ncbi:hypothetical protein BDP27DRAFT_1311146 [Rhodocollybia butyracea]|uniref:F-box domain-containing protein n=1 Tax=Rhodocollybia butyracea TaxID=206335 RepID=A0A9P5Q9H3_9AGAR|nr:hypothetical protein BDP27DRAFT_1311146 [Rhodocollybia butyracea]
MAWPSLRFDVFPSEIVTIIFELGTFSELGKLRHSLDDTPFVFESSCKSNNYSYAPNFPILVSHICHKWREIALNTPSIWSTLFFDRASHLERGRMFLERCTPRSIHSPEYCSGYFLDIVIATVPFKQQSHNDCISKGELEEIFNLLVPVTVRWRSFYLRVRDNTCKKVARDALGFNCGRAPNLETLQLYHFEDFSNVDDLIEATFREPVIVFANDIPRLKHLSLIGVNLPWAFSPYLQGLDTLELALHPNKIRPPYEYWDRMLRLSPQLRKLILHYSGPKDRWDEDGLQTTFAWQGDDLWRSDLPSDRVTLEKLEHLSLTDMDAPYLTRILERIHLPNVQKLVLELSSEEETDYSEFLEKCIGAGMSIIESSSVRLSHGSGLSIPSITTISTADKLAPPLLPFLLTLTSLTLSALDCKLSTLRSLLVCLPKLKELEVDFQRVCMGDSHLEFTPAWRVFAEYDVETGDELDYLSDGTSTRRIPSNNPSHPQCPLLPKLEVFKIIRLGGRQVKQIIRSRECNVRDELDNLPMSSDSYPPLIQTLSPDLIPSHQKSIYIVKYTKEMEEKDLVLQTLIATGCCYVRTPADVIEHWRKGWDTRSEPWEKLSEESPSSVLRRFEPQLDEYGMTTRKAESLVIDGWTKVIVQSEMINADESDPEEYAFTDEETGSDFDDDE